LPLSVDCDISFPSGFSISPHSFIYRRRKRCPNCYVSLVPTRLYTTCLLHCPFQACSSHPAPTAPPEPPPAPTQESELRWRPRRAGRNLPPSKSPLGGWPACNANLPPPSRNLGPRHSLKKSKFTVKRSLLHLNQH
jgi:hypothetical protein